MAGQRVTIRKKKALEHVRAYLGDDNHYKAVYPLLAMCLNKFILINNGKKCSDCGEIITAHSTSGMCRKCYSRWYVKTDKGKEKKRRWRKNRKLRCLSESNKQKRLEKEGNTGK